MRKPGSFARVRKRRGLKNQELVTSRPANSERFNFHKFVSVLGDNIWKVISGLAVTALTAVLGGWFLHWKNATPTFAAQMRPVIDSRLNARVFQFDYHLTVQDIDQFRNATGVSFVIQVSAGCLLGAPAVQTQPSGMEPFMGISHSKIPLDQFDEEVWNIQRLNRNEGISINYSITCIGSDILDPMICVPEAGCRILSTRQISALSGLREEPPDLLAKNSAGAPGSVHGDIQAQHFEGIAESRESSIAAAKQFIWPHIGFSVLQQQYAIEDQGEGSSGKKTHVQGRDAVFDPAGDAVVLNNWGKELLHLPPDIESIRSSGNEDQPQIGLETKMSTFIVLRASNNLMRNAEILNTGRVIPRVPFMVSCRFGNTRTWVDRLGVKGCQSAAIREHVSTICDSFSAHDFARSTSVNNASAGQGSEPIPSNSFELVVENGATPSIDKRTDLGLNGSASAIRNTGSAKKSLPVCAATPKRKQSVSEVATQVDVPERVIDSPAAGDHIVHELLPTKDWLFLCASSPTTMRHAAGKTETANGERRQWNVDSVPAGALKVVVLKNGGAMLNLTAQLSSNSGGVRSGSVTLKSRTINSGHSVAAATPNQGNVYVRLGEQ